MGQRYSSTHSESRNWMEMSSLIHPSTTLLWERTLVPTELEAVLAVWKFWWRETFFPRTVQTVA